MTQGVILLTGAAGYVGKRLLPRLVKRGLSVRCLSRRPREADAEPVPGVEWVQGDVLDPDSLSRALKGVCVAYYLVHSLDHPGDFEVTDRQAATCFAKAACQQGVDRIIYLGGLGDSSQALSSHLSSRQEVGQILRASGPDVVEFRASVIIGSVSLSFELVRALVGRLPAMVCPRWVRTATQPIGTEDLLDYLVAALDLPPGRGGVYEIGGPEQVSYADIMRTYAKERGLRRIMIPVPVLTPWLSSLWLALVTPVYARVGRRLIEGVRNPTVVRDTLARDTFGVRPLGLGECIRAALKEEDLAFESAPIGDMLPGPAGSHGRFSGRWGNRILDHYSATVSVSPSRAFAPIQRIGGDAGWYYADWLWELRGLLDRLFGGPGLHPPQGVKEASKVGDVLDGWKVVGYEPGRRLRLEARMKLPGRAWLEFQVVAAHNGARILQTLAFEPRGTFGLPYWHAARAVHVAVFKGMVREIARRAEADRPER